MKVALYARVSTAHQGTGLEAQVRALKEYCSLNGIPDIELFTDENQSGTKASRPALDRMMSAVSAGEIGSVIVYSFSRFARSVTHLLSALEIFKAKNVGFVSLTEKIDTSTPIGKAIFVIISAISQLERDLIAERVRNGLANARAKGVLIGRKKQRNSMLIRALLGSGMTYRAAAIVAKCSHGSIYAEVVALKKEEAAKKAAEAAGIVEAAKAQLFPEIVPTVPQAA